MTTFDDWLRNANFVFPTLPGPSLDPFVEPTAVADWNLIDIRHIVSRGIVGMIFGWGVSEEGSNTALLVATGVRSVDARPGRFHGNWDYFGVAMIEGEITPHSITVEVSSFTGWPDGIVRVEAGSLLLLVGYSEGFIGSHDAPPDLQMDSDETIWAQIPGWQSPFTPRFARKFP